jgi:hypothetical protein
MVTLKKLLAAGSFCIMVGHLVHRQVILSTFLSELGLSSMVRLTTPTFLRCWAMITLTFIICFLQGDHIILLDAMAHVKNEIFPL